MPATTIILSLLFCCFWSKLTVGFTGIFILQHTWNMLRKAPKAPLVQLLYAISGFSPKNVGGTVLRIWPGLPRPGPLASEHRTRWGHRRKTSSFRHALCMCLSLVLLPGAPCPSVYCAHCKKGQMLNVLHQCCTTSWGEGLGAWQPTKYTPSFPLPVLSSIGTWDKYLSPSEFAIGQWEQQQQWKGSTS